LGPSVVEVHMLLFLLFMNSMNALNRSCWLGASGLVSATGLLGLDVVVTPKGKAGVSKGMSCDKLSWVVAQAEVGEVPIPGGVAVCCWGTGAVFDQVVEGV